jgi:hypothetical protein
MKKFIAIAALGVLTLASCKKDYTCSCTAAGLTTDSVYKDVKKKDAEKACDAASVNYALISGSCSLK